MYILCIVVEYLISDNNPRRVYIVGIVFQNVSSCYYGTASAVKSNFPPETDSFTPNHTKNNPMSVELLGIDEDCETTTKPEIGRNLCRVERKSDIVWGFLRQEGYGGYKIDILTENLTEREKTSLICKRCEGIMKEAYISQIGEQFCSCCEYSNSRNIPDVSIRKMIITLKCSCPLSGRGCKWLGTLENCEYHLDSCSYVYEMCELKCGVVLRRDKLKIHGKEKCSKRNVKCIHCSSYFKSCELEKHMDKCPKMKVSCDLCGTHMKREEYYVI